MGEKIRRWSPNGRTAGVSAVAHADEMIATAARCMSLGVQNAKELNMSTSSLLYPRNSPSSALRRSTGWGRSGLQPGDSLPRRWIILSALGSRGKYRPPGQQTLKRADRKIGRRKAPHQLNPEGVIPWRFTKACSVCDFRAPTATRSSRCCSRMCGVI